MGVTRTVATSWPGAAGLGVSARPAQVVARVRIKQPSWPRLGRQASPVEEGSWQQLDARARRSHLPTRSTQRLRSQAVRQGDELTVPENVAEE
jgi:hypothetical protein